jgi:hypothetical protein
VDCWLDVRSRPEGTPQSNPQIHSEHVRSLGLTRVFASQVILLDKLDLLEKLMPFVRCLNDYLILRNPEETLKRETKAYRVSRMDAAQAAGIEEGGTYRLGMYTASSSQKRAQKDIIAWHKESGAAAASSGPQFIWEFTFPKGCWQATRIKGVSLHKDEHELLMVPYSAVRIKGCAVPTTSRT